MTEIALAEIDGVMYSPRDVACARLLLAMSARRNPVAREALREAWTVLYSEKWKLETESVPGRKGSRLSKFLKDGLTTLEDGDAVRREEGVVYVLRPDILQRISDAYAPL